MQPHDVHVALDDQEAFERRATVARFVESVELATLVKERGLRRVQVLRFALIDDPPAECDGAPARITDREHDAIAKTVVMALAVADLSTLALDDEAKVSQLPPRAVAAPEALQDVVP